MAPVGAAVPTAVINSTASAEEIVRRRPRVTLPTMAQFGSHDQSYSCRVTFAGTTFVDALATTSW
jgi:hypothetical protein